MSKFKVGDLVVISSNHRDCQIYNGMCGEICSMKNSELGYEYMLECLPLALSEDDIEFYDVAEYKHDCADFKQDLCGKLSATDLLNKGKSILEQRGTEYETTSGAGERSFASVAVAFSAITGKYITPAEVCLTLQIVKDVRQWSQDRLHEDSVVDGVNYAALKGEELYKQYMVNK